MWRGFKTRNEEILSQNKPRAFQLVKKYDIEEVHKGNLNTIYNDIRNGGVIQIMHCLHHDHFLEWVLYITSDTKIRNGGAHNLKITFLEFGHFACFCRIESWALYYQNTQPRK